MTDKAKAVMNKLKLRRLFQNPQARDRVLDQFNRFTLDDVGPVGGDQGVALLKDMNDLGQRQEQILRESFPKVTVY